MAENLASRAIGVILSGTGSDGAYGVQAIRAAGGIAIAQSLDTAEYSGMPEAAMETGCIDAILPPAEIAKRFLSLTKVPNGTDPSDMDEDVLNDGYARLLELIEERTHVNFMGYKVATIRRRIDRRIATLELPTFQAYLDHVETHPQEIMAIFRDMMISVTSFFRDPEEYAALEKNVRPIVEQRGERGLRVWIPGCATGEEAYSVAIILVELLGGVGALDTRPLQIFATDIDTDALARARRGHFPDAIMDTVPEELREKYFVRQGAGYTINSAVRDCIVFTQHNVIQDPPFSNVDLVTCRNVMIYFTAELQAKVLTRLHYALRPNGVMMLGKPEWTSGGEELFRQVEPEHKIFKRRVQVSRTAAHVTSGLINGRNNRNVLVDQERRQTALAQDMFDALVRAVGPNCLLVNASNQIKRIYGNVDRFVSLSEGDVRGMTLDVLRKDLRHEVRTLVHLALKNNETRSGAERQLRDESVRVQVCVYPVCTAESIEDMAIVTFRALEIERPVSVPAISKSETTEVSELQKELTTTRVHDATCGEGRKGFELKILNKKDLRYARFPPRPSDDHAKPAFRSGQDTIGDPRNHAGRSRKWPNR